MSWTRIAACFLSTVATVGTSEPPTLPGSGLPALIGVYAITACRMLNGVARTQVFMVGPGCCNPMGHLPPGT